jgi:6-phosphogluconolactonase
MATKYKKTSILCIFLLVALVSGVSAQQFYLFVGTYTNSGNLGDNPKLDSSGSKGIYVYRFDAATGKVKLLSHTEGVCNPSYLAPGVDGRHVYACTESRMKGMGSVSAFEFDRATGQLRFINKVPSGGDNPAYVSEDSSGRWVVVANYTGGSFSVCPIRPDGGVGPAVQRLTFEGHGVNAQRQDKSHVHSAVFSPEMRHLYIQDLGLDRISMYPFDVNAAAPLDTMAVKRFTAVPGAGPRHLIFGPDGRFAYLVEEMGGSVDVYHYDAGTGGLDSIQRIVSHPDTATGSWRGSDIHLTPDGRFLYTSNRAESSVTLFSVEGEKGTLQRIGYTPTFGKEPRNFTVDPSGNWLLVADQESNMVVVYHLDKATGALKPLKSRISVPLPSYVRLMK